MLRPESSARATIPAFMAAWRAETISSGEPYTMRTAVTRRAEVPELDVIKASIPAAIRWLSMGGHHGMPPGSLGNGEAAQGLAALIEAGCDDKLRGHLIHFAVRVGARRLADAATCLARAGYAEAARIAAGQARLVGSMQLLLVTGDEATAAAALRALAPTYDRLRSALDRS